MSRGSEQHTVQLNTHTHTHLRVFGVSREGEAEPSEVTDLQFVAVCQAADRWGSGSSSSAAAAPPPPSDALTSPRGLIQLRGKLQTDSVELKHDISAPLITV